MPSFRFLQFLQFCTLSFVMECTIFLHLQQLWELYYEHMRTFTVFYFEKFGRNSLMMYFIDNYIILLFAHFYASMV